MDVHSDETFVARVKDYVAAHPGEPIRGGGWGATVVVGDEPCRRPRDRE